MFLKGTNLDVGGEVGHTLCNTSSIPGPWGMDGYSEVTSRVTSLHSGC